MAFEENRHDQTFGMGLFPEGGSPLRAMCFFFFPGVVYERVMARLKQDIGTRWGNDELPSVEERRQSVSNMLLRREALMARRVELEGQIGEISGALGA